MSRTVLVVDDAPDIRLLVVAILSRQAFSVIEAGDGVEALAILEAAELPSVIVLDVQMPGMDGWTTLAALRT